MAVFDEILLGADTNISIDETRELLIDCCHLKPLIHNDISYVVSKYVSVNVDEDSDLGKELCLEHYGFESKISLYYNLLHVGTHALEAYSTNYRICGVLLTELYCNLVMLANGEAPKVLRTDGEIFCDDSDPITMNYLTSILFEEMEIDFTFKKLPRY